eukprot:scaffold64434_cov52-Cyclotella_meneghiniana.AAC.5
MPSKKKARGKARREQKEAKAKEAEAVVCDHFARPTDMTDFDYVPCEHLMFDMRDMLKDSNRKRDTLDIINDILREHRESVFEHAGRRHICQQLLLSRGMILVQDLGQELFNGKEDSALIHYGALMACMHEALHHSGQHGSISLKGTMELLNLHRDLRRCPREFVRFFHKRNSCDCLSALYDKLKKKTQRISVCHECWKETEVKDIMSGLSDCGMADSQKVMHTHHRKYHA